MTIAALIGAYSRPTPHKHADECAPIAQKLCSEAVHNGLRHIYVILVLEGTFGNGLQTNTERMVRDRIARMMGRKMKWLNCHIQVVTTQEIGNDIPGVSAAIEAYQSTLLGRVRRWRLITAATITAGFMHRSMT